MTGDPVGPGPHGDPAGPGPHGDPAGPGPHGDPGRPPDASIAGRILAGEDWAGDLGRHLDRVLDRAASGRIDVDEERLEKGLAQLVLTVVELLRQIMERQAIRRVEGGGLSEEQVERLGRALMLLEQRMAELREAFDLREEDLNLDLGPLGRLL